ncbi:NUDIX hydrolase [Aminomonas paucivorans]|uniref:NUDIX hydrolase n=1 Tax=Aminomonas paucivorans TaxID=81412 RepID=UPI0022B51AD1|nr:CoA pyrophosphatase [Aminomonas paucivorans]
MPLWREGGGFFTLLTVRSASLRRHPGQIAFPGGARDPEDRTPGQTAFREAREEVGLLPTEWRPLGLWGQERTFTSRFRVVPVLAEAASPGAWGRFSPDGAEVVTLVPLAVPPLKAGFSWETVPGRQISYVGPTHRLPCGKRVWGLTGRLLWRLSRLCSGEGVPVPWL